MSDQHPQSQDGFYCSHSGPPLVQYSPEQMQSFIAMASQYQQQQPRQPQQPGSYLPPLPPTSSSDPGLVNDAASQPAPAAWANTPQPQQTGKAPRAASRHFTKAEDAAVAQAYVKYKGAIDSKVKSAGDLRQAWDSVQQECNRLAPSIAADFPKIKQIKDKVTQLKSKYASAVEAMQYSGGARPPFVDDPAFKVMEESDMARDPLVRHEGLLDSNRPEGDHVRQACAVTTS